MAPPFSCSADSVVSMVMGSGSAATSGQSETGRKPRSLATKSKGRGNKAAPAAPAVRRSNAC